MAHDDKKSKRRAAASARTKRHLRADAQRNIDLLLQTAAERFARSGVDVPMREIAERAGVGVGTLYRHFPTRSDLVVAVFRKEVGECVDTLSVLAANHPAGDALTRWVSHYVDFIAAHRGLAAALNSGDPALEGLPSYFQQQLGPGIQRLLDTAATAGEIRAGVKQNELLHAVAMLCVPPSCGEPTDPKRMVGLFIDGLRFGAKPTADRYTKRAPAHKGRT
ncbi:TetR/AcrR family transcriptional regulator [Bradyrhizobium manausense]|uniref:TetR/AcrR family transcriptional regulator n=1 Tax=Bradyrhizobium manausense TaxID=989370 RepID=UPI001BA51E7F|nr:TetR/AcrR family transcriptional regulator [Bradyrhizobium manausense]MBR0724960.1 helix-turn-helix transcriptional regulator [Bradyrhizobium manausense]